MDKEAARKAERERRQARIRASGSKRLEKITNVNGTEVSEVPGKLGTPNIDDVPDPDVPRLSSIPSPSSRNDSSHKSQQPPVMASADPLMEFLRQARGPNADMSQDPLFAMLNQANGGGDNDSSPVGGFGSLAALLGQSQPSDSASKEATIGDDRTPTQYNGTAQQRSASRARSELIWDVLYTVSSIMLGLYAALHNPFGLATAFLSVQIGLLCVRLLVGPAAPGLPLMSTLAPLLTILPPHRQRQLSVVGNIVGALRTAYWNFAIVVFVYGLASRRGSEFAHKW